MRGTKNQNQSMIEGSLDAQNSPSGKAEAERGEGRGREGGEATLPLFGQRFCRRRWEPGRLGLPVASRWVQVPTPPDGEADPCGLSPSVKFSSVGPDGLRAQTSPGTLLLPPSAPNPYIRYPPARKSPSPPFELPLPLPTSGQCDQGRWRWGQREP